VVPEALAEELLPLPDAAYLTPCDRRLAVAGTRVPADDGWRAELDLTTDAVEGRVVGRRREVTVAGFARREWESGESMAGVRVSVPLGRRRRRG
jgi:hypothetical protein